MALPLEGIRVLDLTNVLAGPYCTYHLALFGAEVIKVEQPGRGDLARQLGPDAALNAELVGTSYLAQNSGKKSVEINLKDPDGKAAFLEMVREADVVVENFRPGVMARLGLDAEQLQLVTPGLVYCAISGFGQTGPLSQRPAYDQIIQGLSGMMSITGTPDTAPLRVGFPVADSVGGLMAALAVCATLVGRQRGGAGAVIDVSMLEATISAMGWAVSNYLGGGVEPRPMGNDNFTAAPSGTFTAQDGSLNISANRQAQFEALCEVVGREDLVGDPRFATREARKVHREDLSVELNRVLATRTAEEWEDRFAARGVPAARILTVPQALELPQLVQRGFVNDLEFPGKPDRTLTVIGNGVQVDGQSLRPRARPPLLGEHNHLADRRMVDPTPGGVA
ncbi:CaiB/BaiF CoA transferase family protein [Georgenia sunbinii]|uniref:CaiB/BaiF CoA transferase family protein n=1 Tax=Georgenia sunbinii TaxID=3117728 RepID=UPI002F26797B